MSRLPSDPSSAPAGPVPVPGIAERPGVSVVIPTRDRPASLERTLRALAGQSRPPDEVVIVDASAAPADRARIASAHPALRLVVLHAAPGLCAQRNAGIRRSRGSHVLLCDDDIVPPPDYLQTLLAFVDEHPTVGVVTGLVCELNPSGDVHDGLEPPSFRHLLASFVFQHTVWSDVEGARGGRLTSAPLSLLKRWYRRRGNTWSLAGWPLVTQVRGPAFHTATYGLGAALVRRDWLIASPYDERLGPSGIGDHYGVALGFPGRCPIAVLPELRVLHHRAPENRVSPAEAHLQRVLALDHFMRGSGRFSRSSRVWLVWSLLGKAAIAGLGGRGREARASLGALVRVASGRYELGP